MVIVDRDKSTDICEPRSSRISWRSYLKLVSLAAVTGYAFFFDLTNASGQSSCIDMNKTFKTVNDLGIVLADGCTQLNLDALANVLIPGSDSSIFPSRWGAEMNDNNQYVLQSRDGQIEFALPLDVMGTSVVFESVHQNIPVGDVFTAVNTVAVGGGPTQVSPAPTATNAVDIAATSTAVVAGVNTPSTTGVIEVGSQTATDPAEINVDLMYGLYMFGAAMCVVAFLARNRIKIGNPRKPYPSVKNNTANSAGTAIVKRSSHTASDQVREDLKVGYARATLANIERVENEGKALWRNHWEDLVDLKDRQPMPQISIEGQIYAKTLGDAAPEKGSFGANPQEISARTALDELRRAKEKAEDIVGAAEDPYYWEKRMGSG